MKWKRSFSMRRSCKTESSVRFNVMFKAMQFEFIPRSLTARSNIMRTTVTETSLLFTSAMVTDIVNTAIVGNTIIYAFSTIAVFPIFTLLKRIIGIKYLKPVLY